MLFYNNKHVSVALILSIGVLCKRVNGDSGQFCAKTVDISDGQVNGEDITKDGITYRKNDYFVEENVTKGCVCKVKKCLRRCCDTMEFLAEDSEGNAACQTSTSRINLTHDLEQVVNQNISLFHIFWVPDRQVCTEKGEFKIFADSDMKINPSGSLTWEKSIYAYDKFCAANINNHLGALICVVPDIRINAAVSCIGMIISMPFLLITFLVYAILPDRNLHQRALMFYVLTLLISYILLVIINLSESLRPPWCQLFAYSTLFFFMVSFFWMNVICFDIWYTFSGGRGFVGSKRTSERRRLIFYSMYAFGVPIGVVILVLIMQKVLPEDSPHNPSIGKYKCFIADGWPNLWYFYVEAGILVIANIVFFLLTALKIRQVKKETSMLKHNDSRRHTYEKDKRKFNLYVKLLFAMGVNWSMEVISFVVNWRTGSTIQYIWYATDFFNAVYGVFIFFIFVFKKKIWTLLQRRYYNFMGKPHLAHTVTSTNTLSSHFSSTNYSAPDTSLSERTTIANGRARTEELALRPVN